MFTRRLLALVLAILMVAVVLAACSAPAAPPANANTAVSIAFGTGFRYPPSFAVWVVDADTSKTATLFVSAKASDDNSVGINKRPSALPVWFGVKPQEFPGQVKLPDTISGATPTKDVQLKVAVPDKFKGKKLRFFVEANVSYDYNDYYKEGLKPGVEGYNDVNGQPSVIWSGTLESGQSKVDLAVTGRGDVLGQDHAIHTDMDHITTAAGILTKVSVVYTPAS